MNIYDKLEQLSLTESEKTLIDYVIEHSEDIMNMSAADISKNSYVSVSTIYRIIDKLELSGLQAFKSHIHFDRERYQKELVSVVSAKLYSVPKKDDQIIFDLIVLYSKLFFYLFAPWHEPVNLFWMLNDINLRHYLQYVFNVVKGIKPISFSCLNQAEY